MHSIDSNGDAPLARRPIGHDPITPREDADASGIG